MVAAPFSLKHEDGNEREGQERQLGERGVAQPSRSAQGVFEFRQLLLLDDPAVNELADGATNGGVDHDLGQHQERQADHEPTVHAEVVEEGNHDAIADGQSIFERKHEQGKPRQRDDNDRPPNDVGQIEPNQPDPVQKVVDRATNHERKLVYLCLGLRQRRERPRGTKRRSHWSAGSGTIPELRIRSNCAHRFSNGAPSVV